MPMAFQSRRLNILISHAHLRNNRANAEVLYPLLVELSRRGLLNLLVDSGAFTAYTTGRPIPIEEYISWCKNIYADTAWQYIALDAVANPAGTRSNLNKMLAEGLKPMPVQVMNEDLVKVKELVEINPFICVAGGVTQPIPFMQARYKKLFELTEGKARIHGLGFVKLPEMWQVPLFSVDSILED